MASNLHSLGFSASSGEDFIQLAQFAGAHGIRVEGPEGYHYVRYTLPEGPELWAQCSPDQSVFGCNLHFRGKSEYEILISRLVFPGEFEGSSLDGRVYGALGEEYYSIPLAFDAPDFFFYAMSLHSQLPVRAKVQLSAFPVRILALREQGQVSQMNLADCAIIPSGTFSPGGEVKNPPETQAIISGIILESEVLKNSHSQLPFARMLIQTLGGTIDVVSPLENLPGEPRAGMVIEGQFYLVGVISDFVQGERSADPNVFTAHQNDERLQQATIEARERFSSFLQAFESGDPRNEGFSVKIPIPLEGQAEFVWMQVESIDENTIVGRIDNEPTRGQEVGEGQRRRCDISEVADWLFMRDGKMEGNFSLRRVFLEQMPEAEQQMYRMLLSPEDDTSPSDTKPLQSNPQRQAGQAVDSALGNKCAQFLASEAYDSYFAAIHPRRGIILATVCLLTIFTLPYSIYSYARTYARSKELKALRKRLIDLAQEGNIGLAAILVSNTALLEKEKPAAVAPAMALVCPGESQCDARKLAEYADRVFKCADSSQNSPALREVKSLMADDVYREFRWRALPPELFDGKQCYVLDLMLHSDFVDTDSPFVACVIDTAVGGVFTPVPSQVLS